MFRGTFSRGFIYSGKFTNCTRNHVTGPLHAKLQFCVSKLVPFAMKYIFQLEIDFFFALPFRSIPRLFLPFLICRAFDKDESSAIHFTFENFPGDTLSSQGGDELLS